MLIAMALLHEPVKGILKQDNRYASTAILSSEPVNITSVDVYE